MPIAPLLISVPILSVPILPLEITWLDVALTSLVVLIGSTLQGSVGFGMGLLASPLLILIDPRFVPAPILLSTLVLVSLLTYRERHAIDLGGIGWAMVGRAGGTAVAGLVLVALPGDRLLLLFGFLVLAAVAMSVARWRLTPVRPVLVAAGLLSGVLGTIASIGGPPMALVYQNESGARIRSTMSGFFMAGTILSLAALRGVGRFGAYEMRLALLMLPALLVGYVVSGWTAGVVDRGWTRRAVLAVSGASGAVIVLRHLL